MALIDNEMDRVEGLLVEDNPFRRSVLRMDSERYFGELSRTREALVKAWVTTWHDLFHEDAPSAEEIMEMMNNE